MSHKQRLRDNRASLGGAVVAVESSRYATEAEALNPGTRKLKSGFYWGRGAEKRLIVRSMKIR